MKLLFAVALMLVLGLQSVEPAFAARRVVVRRGPRRTVVTVHRGWPLRRPARTVIVRPARTVIRVGPAHYLAPVVFGGVLVTTAPAREMMVWEDSEALGKDDDWTEFTLNSDARGTKLWLSIPSGRVQFDWAEVVFENGDARVVDFKESVYDEGLYPLLDFADGRRVDHVRVVARARTPEAKVALMMEK
jgi:hypothetical protein